MDFIRNIMVSMMEKLILPQIVHASIYRSRLLYKKDGLTLPRTVSYFEIELPIESGGVSFIDARQKEIRPHMVICAKPGQVRYTKLPFSCRYLHLQIESGPLYETLMRLPEYIPITDAENYGDTFEKIASLCQSESETDRILVHSMILRLVYDLDREVRISEQRLKSPQSSVITAVKNYIREDLTRDLSLKAIADHVAFSPTYLHTVFLQKTGVTLHRYVEEKRIQKSIELLTNTTLTLTEIALECGFGSQSYYSYAFKKAKGLSPRKYVKELHKQYPSLTADDE